MDEEKITPVALVMCKTFNAVANDLLHVAPVYGFFDGDDAVLMIWRKPSKNTSGRTEKSST